MVSNDKDGLSSTDMFFILNTEGEIDSIYSESFTSSSGAAVSAPSMKRKQGFGYDSNNVIQVGSLTLSRGDKELGGVVTLGQSTNYEVIVSRSITNTGSPFTFQDRVYGTKQESDSSYYYFTDYTMSYNEGDDGAIVGDVYLHAVSQHSTKENMIKISSFKVSSGHELTSMSSQTF